jgi:hypothetical protein
MRIVRQARLSLTEGGADKRYEVDLCEVSPGRFAVNFRFGRAGGRLQEGSRTPLPVSEAEATRIFDRLVAERAGKGYRELGSAAEEGEDEAQLEERIEDVPDPRHQRLVALIAGEATGWTADLDKLIWRAGELRVRAAAPGIAAVDPGAMHQRAWHVARALLRCGDPSTVEAARALTVGRPDWVVAMARHAVADLAEDEALEAFRAEQRALVPPSILGALEAGQLPVALKALDGQWALLDLLYLVAERDPFLALLEQVRVEGDAFLGVRRVWKAAEARGDGEVWGILVRRIERDKKAGGNRPVPKAQFGRRVFQHPRGGTRKYLRRRGWRTMRRLGEAGLGEEYCRMAAGVLLAYTDELARPAPTLRGRAIPGDEPRFPADWALGHVLFDNSPRYAANLRYMSFRRQWGWRGGAVQAREEAFPRLWDDAPELLADLLDRSRVAEVHEFAARALRANPDAWHRIPVRRLVGWFGAPYPETARLAAEIAVTRYDPDDPDLDLVQALLDCAFEEARATAEQWVRENPGPFLRNPAFVTALVLSPIPQTRRLALEVLAGASLLPDQAAAVVREVVAAALRMPAEADEAQVSLLRDAATVLAAAFGPQLAELPLDLVVALIRHPSEGVAELGARILLTHRIRPAELPDDVLAAAMTSTSAAVRGIGIRLYGELPDAVLADRFRVLVHLVINPHPDVRVAVRPIVVRLAATNQGFARVLLGALVPLLAADGPEGMHRDVVRLLRTDLASALSTIPPAQVFRLLRASETVVQELGGELLRTNVDPASVTPAQLAILASSDVLGVRRTAWIMLAARVEAVREAPESVLPMLDARWEDSRERAFAFVQEQVGVEHLPAEVVLAVCDSVRPDVQAFGRQLVAQRFDHAEGWRYLARLAQHPTSGMQAFAASWLEAHAAGDPERIARLAPFVVTVLAAPNRGRVAKLRVLAFLESQLPDPACAQVIAPLLSELVLTVASSHRARYVAMLAELRRLHPEIDTPLRVVEPEVRGAV